MINIAKAVDIINSALDKIDTPANTLPPTLLKAAAMCRPGLSPYKIATKIIENNKILGIPTGPNPDGSENMINQYTYNVVKCICDAIREDAVVHVAIPMDSLLIQAIGANAGGTVVCTGRNLTDSISKGTIQ